MLSTVTFTSPKAGASPLTLHSASGTNRLLSQVDGLFGPPPPRIVSRPAPQRDGTIDNTRFLQARTITMNGELWNTTPATVEADFQTVSAAFAESLLAPGTLTVTRTDGVQFQTSVKLADSVQTSLQGGGTLMQYQVTFVAPDPLLYGTSTTTTALASTPKTTVTSGGITYYKIGTTTAINVTNNGTAPAPLKVTVVNGSTNEVQNLSVAVTTPSAYASLAPGGSTQFLNIGTIEQGLTVVYDTSQRSFTDTAGTATYAPGAPQVDTEWPLLYPGTSTVTWTTTGTSSTAYPTCTISYRDAWW